jgi:hypothetical protein
MDHIWLVCGSTGEYDDRTDWRVAAYPDEESAQKHCALANTKAEAFFKQYGEEVFTNEKKFVKLMKKIDPKAKIDYTGTFILARRSFLIPRSQNSLLRAGISGTPGSIIPTPGKGS